MKVLSSPDIVNWKKKCKCNTCLSELEVTPDDLRHEKQREYHSGDWPDQGWYDESDNFFVTCPMCSKKVNVSYSDMPYLLRDKVKKRNDKTK